MKMRRSEYPTDSALERLRRFVTGDRRPKKDERKALQEESEAQKPNDKSDTDRQD